MTAGSEPDDEDHDGEPLSARELRRVRAMLQSEDRVVWFWATCKVWATWIAALSLGITLGWDGLKKIIAALK